MIKIIPNGLTVLRLLLAFAFPFAPPNWYLGIVLVALATEFLDGWLARLWRVESRFGRMLDPIADKAFLFIVFATLAYHGQILWWQFLLVGARDIYVQGRILWGFITEHTEGVDRAFPRWAGKITTTLQFALLIQIMAMGSMYVPLFWITGVASLVAAVDYAMHGP